VKSGRKQHIQTLHSATLIRDHISFLLFAFTHSSFYLLNEIENEPASEWRRESDENNTQEKLNYFHHTSLILSLAAAGSNLSSSAIEKYKKIKSGIAAV
jgi:hypothetical protein